MKIANYSHLYVIKTGVFFPYPLGLFIPFITVITVKEQGIACAFFLLYLSS